MPPHLEADDAHIVASAVDLDEAQVRGWAGEILSPGESPVADHDHMIRASPLEKSMGEKNRFLGPPGHVRRDHTSSGVTEPLLVRSERNDETGLGAGADEHHLLTLRQIINQGQKLFSRGLKASSRGTSRLHAGAQVDHHHHVA